MQILKQRNLNLLHQLILMIHIILMFGKNFVRHNFIFKNKSKNNIFIKNISILRLIQNEKTLKKIILYKKYLDNSHYLLSNANFDDLNNLYYDSHPWNDKEIYFNDYIYVSNLEKKIRLKVANIFKEKLKFEKRYFLGNIISVVILFFIIYQIQICFD